MVKHHKSEGALVATLKKPRADSRTFAERVADYQAVHNCSTVEAVGAVQREHPELARAHLAGAELPIARSMQNRRVAIPTTHNDGNSRLLAEAKRRVEQSSGRMDLRDAIREAAADDPATVTDYVETFNVGPRR